MTAVQVLPSAARCTQRAIGTTRSEWMRLSWNRTRTHPASVGVEALSAQLRPAANQAQT